MPEGVIGNVHEGLVIVAIQQVYDLGIPHPGIGGDLLFFLQVRFRSRLFGGLRLHGLRFPVALLLQLFLRLGGRFRFLRFLGGQGF